MVCDKTGGQINSYLCNVFVFLFKGKVLFSAFAKMREVVLTMAEIVEFKLVT